ncbi:MAG: hypothetical protein IPO72_02615 [Saprospiraceae bacterium]|nr:hypothetical protein [Candidatus Vicinibacter affinis]
MNSYKLWTDNIRLRKRYYTITDKEGNNLKELNENGQVWTVDYETDFCMEFLSNHGALKVIKTNGLTNCFAKEHFKFKSTIEIIIGFLTFWINFPVPKYVISNKNFKDGYYLINILYKPKKEDNYPNDFENFHYGIDRIERIFDRNINTALDSKYVFSCRDDANNYIKMIDPYTYFNDWDTEIVFVNGKANTIERIIMLGFCSISLIFIDLIFNSSFKLFIYKFIDFLISLNFNVFNYCYIGSMLFIIIKIFFLLEELKKDN